MDDATDEPADAAAITPEPKDTAAITPEPKDTAAITPEPKDTAAITPEPKDTAAITPEPAVALQVVHGNPTPEELAALVAVAAARTGGEEAGPAPRSLWSTPALRGSHHPAPAAWRASALPR